MLHGPVAIITGTTAHGAVRFGWLRRCRAQYHVQMTTPISPHRDGCVLVVWVVPRARRTEITGIHGDALRIRVAAPPEGGKANRVVARLLTKTLDARVSLLGGAGSRRKRYLLAGMSAQEATRRIGSLVKTPDGS